MHDEVDAHEEEGEVFLLLRGIIVNRTYGIDKNQYI